MEFNSKVQVFLIGRRKGERPLDICGYKFYRNFTHIRNRIKQNMKMRWNNEKSRISYNGMLVHCESRNLVKNLNGTINMKLGDIKIKKLYRKLDGIKMNLDNILGKSLTITDFEFTSSTKKVGTKYVKLQYTINGDDTNKMYYSNTGSVYIIGVLSQIPKECLPIEDVVIKKERGYYIDGTLTDDAMSRFENQDDIIFIDAQSTDVNVCENGNEQETTTTDKNVPLTTQAVASMQKTNDANSLFSIK